MTREGIRKGIVRTLKILSITVATVTTVLVVLLFVLNSSFLQDKLKDYSTFLLSEKLQTEVSIDSANVNIFTQEIRLQNVGIKDLQQRDMLHIERLSVSFEWMPLLRKEVHIASATIKGLQASIYKASPDTAANYQFLVDAFKKDKTQADTTQRASEPKKKLKLDVRRIEAEDVSVTYNNSKIALAKLSFKESSLSHLEARMNFSGLRFTNDNHLPRKNAGKPHRGAFDAGHTDMTANGQIDIRCYGKDTLAATLLHLDATDMAAGIHLKNLTANLTANKREADLKQVFIELPNTTLEFDRAHFVLPSKKEQRQLSYSTSVITGQVLLKDIAKPFAPVLSAFGIPLELKVTMSGDDNSMSFQDISVRTTDGKLKISAHGGIKDLRDKYKMNIRFDIARMTATSGTAKHIINQFPIKKFMMKQVQALGNIKYKGNIAILWRKEQFSGKLNTELGALDFDFYIDENNKYVVGKASTADLDLSRAFDVKNLGHIVSSADFSFDISKTRTAMMRKKKGGKLPIGKVSADIDEVSWKKLKFRHLNTTIESDGATAEGKVVMMGKYIDKLCSFSFTSTDSINSKLKVKPGLKFHSKTTLMRDSR